MTRRRDRLKRPSTRQRKSCHGVPPSPLPSILTGKEPTGSDSERSEEMDSEKCIAKRSINVCVKLKWYAEVRLWVCYGLGDCTSFECQALAHLLYTKEGPTKATSA